MEIEGFLKRRNFADPDNYEDFLDLADFTRDLIAKGDKKNLAELARRILNSKYFEAFSWIVSILQEKTEDNKFQDFSCDLGRQIDAYDEFTEALGIESAPYQSTTRTLRGKDGEVQSFYNINILKTKYDGVYLVTMENFDTKDNDFIKYKLLSTQHIDKYVERLEDSSKFLDDEDDEHDLENKKTI